MKSNKLAKIIYRKELNKPRVSKEVKAVKSVRITESNLKLLSEQFGSLQKALDTLIEAVKIE